MNRLFWMGFCCVGAGLIGLLSTLYIGFILSNDRTASPEIHLTSALISTALLTVGSLALMRSSSQLIRMIQLSSLQSNSTGSDSTRLLITRRQNVQLVSISAMLTSLLSLITGTVSQAGRFPLLHGICGIALIGITAAAAYYWLKLWMNLRS